MQIRATENTEGFASCGCGRSPSGVCNGWHALSEEQWQAKIAEQRNPLGDQNDKD